jgi:hypothetical protein
LKGEVAVGEALDLAQEMLFATTQPYFSIGTETLVFGVPLPNYSSFREALPEGRHWRWTERLETASDVAVLTDPALTEAVARYLETREDAEASADFFVHALIGPNTRIRQEILAAIAARREIPPLLDAGRLQPLAAWLRDGGGHRRGARTSWSSSPAGARRASRISPVVSPTPRGRCRRPRSTPSSP